jgi:hypothetical protein
VPRQSVGSPQIVKGVSSLGVAVGSACDVVAGAFRRIIVGEVTVTPRLMEADALPTRDARFLPLLLPVNSPIRTQFQPDIPLPAFVEERRGV